MFKYGLLAIAIVVMVVVWNFDDSPPEELSHFEQNIARLKAIDLSTLSEAERVAVKDAIEKAERGELGPARQKKASRELRSDCGGAPESAVVVPPDDLKELIRVYCSSFGHAIVAAKGTLWNTGYEIKYDMSHPVPANLPAYIYTEEERKNGTRPIVNHDAHFISIESKKLTGDARLSALRHFGGWFETAEEDEMGEVLEISVTNYQGIVQKIIFSEDRWGSPVGYFCRPDCAPLNRFSTIEWKTTSQLYKLDEQGRPMRDENGDLIPANGDGF